MNCTIDDCGKEATHTFVWPWGAEGACCTPHVVVVQQKAKNARGKFGQVSFTRLDPDRPVEIRRDERIELHSARLTAEAERDDARLRASQLFSVNTQLSQEVRAHRARCVQLEADCKVLREQVELCVRERDAALVAADHAREEAERLGVVLSEAPKDTYGTGQLQRELVAARDDQKRTLEQLELQLARVNELELQLVEYRGRETPPEGLRQVVEGVPLETTGPSFPLEPLNLPPLKRE